MRLTILIPLLILLAAIVLVGIVLFSGSRMESGPYQLAVLPTPELLPPISTPTPSAETFVELFPTIVIPTRVPVTEEPSVAPEPSIPQPEQTPEAEVPPIEPGRNALINLLLNWNYVDFTQIASTKRGRLEHFGTKEQREVTEGMPFEHDIVVASLSPEAAIMQLGSATYALPLIKVPAFLENLKNRKGPLTPEEQQQGLDYYMQIYGNKMKELSRDYRPLPGVNLPKPPSKQQIEESKRRYKEVYGRQFQQEQALTGQQNLDSAETQRQNFERYWRTYHPDKPMPTFVPQPLESLPFTGYSPVGTPVQSAQ
jgi:hypothetical protein